MNGKTNGDYLGQMTCYNYKGSSVVDYVIVDDSLFKPILTFKVSPPHFRSSNSMLQLSFRIYPFLVEDEKLNKLPPLYKWDKRLKDQCIQFLTSDVSMQAIGKLNEILHLAVSNIDLDCIDSTVEGITRILLDAADKCFTKINNRTKRRRRQSNQKKWCDCECYQLKSKLQNLAYLVKKFPRNPFLRGKLITTWKTIGDQLK